MHHKHDDPSGYLLGYGTANGLAGGPYNVTASIPSANVLSASVGGKAPAAVHPESPASPTFSLTNLKASPSLTVTASPTTLVYGQPVTITATSSPLSAGGSYPTGAVTFYDNTTTLTPPSARPAVLRPMPHMRWPGRKPMRRQVRATQTSTR